MKLAILAVVALLTSGLGAQVTAPYIETFDAHPSVTLTPGTGVAPLGPSWDYTRDIVDGRARIADPLGDLGVTFPYAPAGGTGNGPKVLVIDKAVSGGNPATNEVVLHIDGIASDAGNGFVVRFRIRDELDESDLVDVIALQDGVTPGTGVLADGSSTGAPGTDGFQEVLLLDWTNSGAQQSWTEFAYLIDPAWLVTNGLVPGSDMRLIFRQSDNFSFETGIDGLLVDNVQIVTMAPGGGQPPQPGLATLDVNAATEANGFSLASGLPGPYQSQLAGGVDLLQLTITGTPQQGIVLVAGALQVGAQTFGSVGQFDLGGPLVVIADGTTPLEFFDFLFFTDSQGVMSFTSTSGALAPGTVMNLQAAVTRPAAPFVALTNTLTLTIL